MPIQALKGAADGRDIVFNFPREEGAPIISRDHTGCPGEGLEIVCRQLLLRRRAEVVVRLRVVPHVDGFELGADHSDWFQSPPPKPPADAAEKNQYYQFLLHAVSFFAEDDSLLLLSIALFLKSS